MCKKETTLIDSLLPFRKRNGKSMSMTEIIFNKNCIVALFRSQLSMLHAFVFHSNNDRTADILN